MRRRYLRAGFGIFYSPTNATSVGRQSGLFSTGYSFAQTFPQVTSGRVPALILDNGVPAFAGTLPITDPSLANGGTIEYMNAGAGKPGYMSSWTFNLQRELPGQFLLDIGYIGQRGTALPSGLENLNQVDFKYLSLGNTLNADINSAGGSGGWSLPSLSGLHRLGFAGVAALSSVFRHSESVSAYRLEHL